MEKFISNNDLFIDSKSIQCRVMRGIVYQVNYIHAFHIWQSFVDTALNFLLQGVGSGVVGRGVFGIKLRLQQTLKKKVQRP
jgi:hypothetical protein